MPNGFFHFFDFDKVNNSTRNEANTELDKEMHKVSKVIDIWSHNDHVDAHEELQHK